MGVVLLLLIWYVFGLYWRWKNLCFSSSVFFSWSFYAMKLLIDHNVLDVCCSFIVSVLNSCSSSGFVSELFMLWSCLKLTLCRWVLNFYCWFNVYMVYVVFEQNFSSGFVFWSFMLWNCLTFTCCWMSVALLSLFYTYLAYFEASSCLVGCICKG